MVAFQAFNPDTVAQAGEIRHTFFLSPGFDLKETVAIPFTLYGCTAVHYRTGFA